MVTATDLHRAFPALLEPELVERILAEGREVEVQAGDRIMDYDRYIKSVPLLLDGLVKIVRQDEDGKELLLYYLKAGETCAMSLTCCMAARKSTIRAEVEEGGRMLALPVEAMERWTEEFPSWRRFVMGTYADRFEEVLQALDAVAFLQLDERLVQYLEERRRVTGSDMLELSHQEVADELHSSREVISRLLKKLERDGRVELGRHRIRLKTAPAAPDT